MTDTWRKRVEQMIKEYGFICIVRGDTEGDTTQHRQLLDLVTAGRCDQCGGEIELPTAIQVAVGGKKAGMWECVRCGWKKPR